MPFPIVGIFAGAAKSIPLTIEYLVLAGGGGRGDGASSGGAGGYRANITGEMSGGGASKEADLTLLKGTNYTVTVGAGGVTDSNGSNSVFHTITSLGGGRGGGNGFSGGSGGGANYLGTGGAGTSGQGYNGGNGGQTSGGGGGAGQVGANGGLSIGGKGGDGVASSITGTSVYRGGGGRGLDAANGLGNGSPNLGGGSPSYASAGDSGVVILRYPVKYTITLGAGLTGSTSTVGTKKVTIITGGTGNVSWS